VKPAETICYTTADKRAMTSLNETSLRTNPGKQHVTKCFLLGQCDVAIETLLRGGVLWWVRQEAM
jgi:hypothetical protein